MAVSRLRLIKHCVEFVPKDEAKNVPHRTRGVYVLFKYRPRLNKYDVLYIGMAGGERKAGICGRLGKHKREKGDLWTHFSLFEVWDNIREDEVRELEGIFRHIYRKDNRANRLNLQKSFKKLSKVRQETIKEGWMKVSGSKKKTKKKQKK